MKREEVIAAIEKLRGRELHSQQIKDIEQQLQLFSDRRMRIWHRGWIRKVLLAGIFGPILVALFQIRSWRHFSMQGFSAWWILVWFVMTIALSWVYMRLQPGVGSNHLGLHNKCVRCKCTLSGLPSALGDEVWVGPAVCPGCGQGYPAVEK